MFRPLLWLSCLWFLVVACSLLVSVSNGTPASLAVRDGSAYALLATAPIFAMDGRSSRGLRYVVALFVLAGLLSALSFLIEWSTHRGILSFPLKFLVLPSFLLPAALFTLTLANVFRGQRWVVASGLLAITLFSCYLITGTRTSLILLVVPVAVVAFTGSAGFWHRMAWAGSIVAFGVFLLVFVAEIVEMWGGRSGDQAVRRLFSVTDAFGPGNAGLSMGERLLETRIAWAAFLAHPVFGVGAGHQFEWISQFGGRERDIYLDSPMATLAKFGLTGLILYAASIAAFVRFYRMLPRTTGSMEVLRASLIGYGALVIVWAALQTPFEEKGFGLAAVLLLSLVNEANKGQLNDRTATAGAGRPIQRSAPDPSLAP